MRADRCDEGCCGQQHGSAAGTFLFAGAGKELDDLANRDRIVESAYDGRGRNSIWDISAEMNRPSACWRFGVLLSVAPALAAHAALARAETRAVSSVADLNYWASNYNPGDEIVIAAGTYDLTTNLWLDMPDVVVRGATGNRNDVILYGGGMNNINAVREAIQLRADDIEVRDLTVSGFFHHAIHLGPGTDRSLIHNVHTLNIGSHHMKGAKFNDDGIIEYSFMEQTEVRQNLPGRTDNYGGGIDLHGARNWHIHDNLAVGVQPISGGDGGIFLWNESSNALIERNVIVDCARGIALGNPSNPNNVVHMNGAVVRNNFVALDNDIGLELCFVKNVQAYNNTIYQTSGTYFRSVHLLDDYAGHYIPMENVELGYNIIRGNILDNARAGGYTLTGNIVGATVANSWFVDAANGNLHLTEAGAAPIDAAQTLAVVPEDIDGGLRPAGDFSDVGADEFASPMGDANYDGLVDGGDYTIWADNYDGPGNWGSGDFSLNGFVDGADYTLWADSYGFGWEKAVIPGPATLGLLAPGGLVLTRRRKRTP